MSSPSVTEEDVSESCPICLHEMSSADLCHPIECPAATCHFNFCLSCLEKLLISSCDDYEMASDGNRHVKVRLNCPSCRANIANSIEGTIMSRRQALSHKLQRMNDSSLSAKELQLKYWKKEDGVQIGEKDAAKLLEVDPTLLRGLEAMMSEEEKKFVTKLMTSGYPEDLSKAAQILSGIVDLIRNRNVIVRQNVASKTNNNGNTTSPNSAAASAARTATALHSANTNMRHGYSNAGLVTRSRNGERGAGISAIQKQMEDEARDKIRRPLPARMPLCISLSTGEFEKMALKSREQQAEPAEPQGWFKELLGKGAERIRPVATMTFVDDEWDGSVADAFARARIGEGERRTPVVKTRAGPKNLAEQASVKKILSATKKEERRPPVRCQRVLIASARGQAGKSGIQKGDVVTHVDGQVFTGNAAALNTLLINAYNDQGHDGVVVIVVNAEECTAEALRLRSLVR